ncbi:MAG TPA: WecB/TagA/CpsF family glycosyltransferase [Gemmatimonadaceae bacterium]|nr:WecB/TagA/CpsF family glycosyltransferase [Gemmatimonadaceae bacterium]
MSPTSELAALTATAGTRTPRVNVLGVGVSAINMELALATIGGWVEGGTPHYVCVSGVHGVIESQRSASLRHIHNAAGLVTPDGMPLVWIGRVVVGPHVDRVYGPDLMLACCERFVSRGYRHFLYGGAPGVPEQLAARLQARMPGLIIAGTYSPPFGAISPEQDEDIVRMINEAEPDLVWVGLSTPKQERWMHEHRARLSAPVLLGVGAAFDFHAGLKRQAPRWMQRNGLEWLFRLLSEPRRLGRRYLVNNPQFVWLLLRQVLGLSSYELTDGVGAAPHATGRME